MNDREITPYQRIADLERENAALRSQIDQFRDVTKKGLPMKTDTAVTSRRIHVIPVGGIEPIHAASENCECQPYCEEGGTTVHHAFDAREIRERHNHQRPDEKWVLVMELS